MSLPPPSHKQTQIIWTALTGLALATIVALVVGLIWGVGQVLRILGPVLWPLAVAGVLAYLLDPVVDWLQKKGMSRRAAILSVFGIALLLLGLLLASVVPQIVRETRDLAQRVPGYVERLQSKAEGYLENPPDWVRRYLESGKKPAAPQPPPATAIPGTTNASTTPAQVETAPADTTNAPGAATASGTNGVASLAGQIDGQTLQTAGSWAASALPKVGKWILSQLGRVASWFAVLAALALIPIYAYYLLAEKRGIQSRWTCYLPVADSSFKEELVFIVDSANNYMIAFFRGQMLVAICDGIMYAIGFMIIGLPYAVLLGAVAIFLTLIPFLGAIITCAAAMVLALVQYGDLMHPLLVLLVFTVVQTIEGFIIVPKILGDKVGLHPLTIIIAVMAGTTLLGGLLGGILAIPLTALLRAVLARYIWKRELPGNTE